MNDFLVFHLQKFHQADLTGMEKHLDRSAEVSKNKDIDISRTHLNYNIKDMHADSSHLREKVMERVNARSNNKKKLRKDAVVFCSCIVSASPSFFKDKTPEYIQGYFECAVDYLDSQFGAKNCVYAITNFDEATDHMHYGFVPLTEDNELCAKKVITRARLSEIQGGLAQHLQEHGYDIMRGMVNSPSTHQDTYKWKRNEREKASLLELRDQIDKRLKELKEQRTEILKAMRKQQKISEQNLKDAQLNADEKARLEQYKKVLEQQDKNVQLTKLMEDNKEQEKLLIEKQRMIDEKLAKVDRNYWEGKAMATMKKENPALYEKLIQKEKQKSLAESHKRLGLQKQNERTRTKQ